MPRPEQMAARRPVTRSQIAADLCRLGLRTGVPTMVHASISSIGWVVGGSQALVEALLDAIGPRGTLCAQASWEDIPFGLDRWPPDWRTAYLAELPPFDPRLSAAAPYEGRLAERIRTWPGAHRSANPGTGLAAIGRDAHTLTAGHRLDDGFGPGTPYARIVEADGQVALVGAPLHTISLLHHAEATAGVPARRTAMRLPVAANGGIAWREIREIDVWDGPFPYERVVPSGEPPLAHIAQDALRAGIGAAGHVGDAASHVFPARGLVEHARAWLETRFAKPDDSP